MGERGISRARPDELVCMDSSLEGDGFELLVPRHKSRGFPEHSGHCEGIGGARKRYHLMVQPLFFCAWNHSTEPGWGTV